MSSDTELLNKIAKLNNAIQQKKQEQYNKQPHPTMYNNNNNNNMVSRPPFNRSTISHNKSLVINNNNNSHKAIPTTIRPSIPSIQQRPPPYTTFNKTLVNSTSVYTKPMTTGRPQPPSIPPQPFKPTFITHLILIQLIKHFPTTSFIVNKSKNKKIILRNNKVSPGVANINRHVDSNGQIIVTIDGVPYITKGKKLVRQDTNINNNNSNNATSLLVPKILVRKVIKRRDKNKNLVIGKSPIIKKTIIKRKNIRSNKGNMVLIREPEGYERHGKHGKTLVNKATVLKQQQNKIPYCGIFTRYGKCPNPHCRFRHDQQHVAICPVFLLEKSRKCPYGNHCRLSHQPSPFNLPRCIHFQRLKCKLDPCPFLHVRVDPKAPLCRAFAIEGYCSKGNACKNKHILVCPDFTILGKCDKKGCRLPHVDSNKNDYQQKKEINEMKSKQQWIRPELKQQLEKDKIKKSKNQHFQNKSIINTTSTPATTHSNGQHNMGIDNNSNNNSNSNNDNINNNSNNNNQSIEKGENGEDLFIPLFDNNDDGDYWNQYLVADNDDLEEIKTLRFNNDDDDDDDDDDNDNDDDNEDNENNNTSENEEEDDGEEVDDMDEDEEEQEGEEDSEDGEQIYYEVLDSDDDVESIEEIYEEVSDNDDLMVHI
ncbi:unnamed protein product [Cunninghamella blakesleeana]